MCLGRRAVLNGIEYKRKHENEPVIGHLVKRHVEIPMFVNSTEKITFDLRMQFFHIHVRPKKLAFRKTAHTVNVVQEGTDAMHPRMTRCLQCEECRKKISSKRHQETRR